MEMQIRRVGPGCSIAEVAERVPRVDTYLVTPAGRVGRVQATRVYGGERYHEVAYAGGTLDLLGMGPGEVRAFGDPGLLFEYVAMLIEQEQCDLARDVARGMSDLLKSPVATAPESA